MRAFSSEEGTSPPSREGLSQATEKLAGVVEASLHTVQWSHGDATGRSQF